MTHPTAQVALPTGAVIDVISVQETRLLTGEIFESQVYNLEAVKNNPAPLILDIGANIGLFVHYAKHCIPNSMIYAVELVPPIATVLKKNVEGLNNVKVIECGIAGSIGSMEVTFYPGYSIMSRLNADARTDEEFLTNCIRYDLKEKMINKALLNERFLAAALGNKLKDPVKYDCPVKTLHALVSEEGIRKIDFLKMDIEGSELDVLRKLEPEIWAMIENIAIEVHEYAENDDNLAELKLILENQGYATSTGHVTAEGSPRTAMLYGS